MSDSAVCLLCGVLSFVLRVWVLSLLFFGLFCSPSVLRGSFLLFFGCCFAALVCLFLPVACYWTSNGSSKAIRRCENHLCSPLRASALFVGKLLKMFPENLSAVAHMVRDLQFPLFVGLGMWLMVALKVSL
ncbi:hypothetical protein QYF36_002110 [Acer negundo]|nr:hypothetical protein QYF36_002110 [Acer negundo]